MESINWFAILLATLSSFVLGFIWYNPKVFGTAWAKAAGIDMEDPEARKGMGKIFGMAFLFAFIMATFASYFLYNHMGSLEEVLRVSGLYLGFGIIAMNTGVTGMYERKSLVYILINGGYQIVSLMIFGLIFYAMS
ncbi:DUF1761 domain-containing protein [Phaeocystidibacter marisrubri]|uniref:DUF1761 domain-containing protein n=1 Tax=Phaeocystidibacter marisrubri TaxID=1577780 RepID=A0A6L3ZCT8_9FLAO|nr:DUF1761 domain-containing protein [Phaeocystidibacter marisrubri]KAB2815681.1 DUF1761 domain-containing protein [Phaeocystidibacter marisrubri]GGH65157.1 membrane protein [Phaeocystidibacter marisrubri]